jgi:hypothetical protein
MATPEEYFKAHEAYIKANNEFLNREKGTDIDPTTGYSCGDLEPYRKVGAASDVCRRLWSNLSESDRKIVIEKIGPYGSGTGCSVIFLLIPVLFSLSMMI